METITTHTSWHEKLEDWQADFPQLDLNRLIDKTSQEDMNEEAIILECLAEMDETEPDWTYVASRIHLIQMYRSAATHRMTREPYTNFHGLIECLTEKHIYSPNLLTYFSKEEIDELEKTLVPERDRFFYLYRLENNE